MCPRNIRIRPVLNGFVCEVGCQTIVVKSVDELTAEIRRYYLDPRAVEQEYLRKKVNDTEGTGQILTREASERVPTPDDNIQVPQAYAQIAVDAAANQAGY